MPTRRFFQKNWGRFWLTPDFDASGMSLGTAWWVEDLSAGYGFRIRFLVSWMEFPFQKCGEKQQHILPTCGDFRVFLWPQLPPRSIFEKFPSLERLYTTESYLLWGVWEVVFFPHKIWRSDSFAHWKNQASSSLLVRGPSSHWKRTSYDFNFGYVWFFGWLVQGHKDKLGGPSRQPTSQNWFRTGGSEPKWHLQGSLPQQGPHSFITLSSDPWLTEDHVIRPATRAERCSYVELIADELEQQMPKWFVSHAWQEVTFSPTDGFCCCWGMWWWNAKNATTVRLFSDANSTGLNPRNKGLIRCLIKGNQWVFLSP